MRNKGYRYIQGGIGNNQTFSLGITTGYNGRGNTAEFTFNEKGICVDIRLWLYPIESHPCTEFNANNLNETELYQFLNEHL